MMRINDVTIEWEIEKQPELEEYIKKSFDATVAYEQIEFDCSLEVLIVDEQTIQAINYEYRNIERVTDVLSFPLYENHQDAKQDIVPGQPLLLGNMVLCLPRAVEQAEQYGHSLKREVCFLTVHSTLHLLGYDHELGAEQENIMFEKQNEILKNMGVNR